jgi:NADH:ubiquinone oxidoreductase subunit 4 (subunit M)
LDITCGDELPILTSLVALPFIGGVAVLFTGRDRPALARWLALGVSVATFLVSLVMWARFDPASPEYHSWSSTRGCRTSASRTTWAWTASACC